MAHVTFWGKPGCVGNARQMAVLRASGHVLDVRNLLAEAWTPERKNRLVQQLQEIYRTAADPGLHAAAEWLLRTWQQESWLKQVNDEWAAASNSSAYTRNLLNDHEAKIKHFHDVVQEMLDK